MNNSCEGEGYPSFSLLSSHKEFDIEAVKIFPTGFIFKKHPTRNYLFSYRGKTPKIFLLENVIKSVIGFRIINI